MCLDIRHVEGGIYEIEQVEIGPEVAEDDPSLIKAIQVMLAKLEGFTRPAERIAVSLSFDHLLKTIRIFSIG